MRSLTLPFLPSNTFPVAKDDALALYDDRTGWINYGDVRSKVARAAQTFNEGKRGLVVCCLPNNIDGVLAYLAAAASGHAICLANPELNNIDTLIANYQPEWVVTPEAELDGYRDVKWGLDGLQVFQRKTQSEILVHPDLYLLLLTSGSTGSSKSVRLSYDNITSNTQAIIESLDLTSDQRALAHLPLFYSFGLSVLHSQLAVGASCVLIQQGMMSRDFWKTTREQKATLFPGVPYHYEMLAKLGLQRLDAPELKIFLQAGGKIRNELAQDIWSYVKNKQGRFFIMYGQTEASPRICCLPVHQRPDKIGSCGKVLSGGHLVIEDGEVVYLGKNVMMGYAENRIDLGRGDDMHGRLMTGDLGFLDEEFYLTITGRKQRFAKLFGQRISLDDLETLAGKISPAYALESPEKIVIVIPSTDYDAQKDIHRHVVTETTLNPVWLEVRGIENIPYKANGKVDYQKLKELLCL